MYEIKCLIVSDRVANVSILTLLHVLVGQVRSGAEGGLKLLEGSLPLLLLHFLPHTFFFFLSNLGFELAALRHCLHLRDIQFRQAFQSTQVTGDSHTLKSKREENAADLTGFELQ